MAMTDDKNNRQGFPLAPANGYPRSDEEATFSSDELRRKKRTKWAIYIALFVVFQTIVIAVFALTVMKVKTPKVRLGTVTVQTMETGTVASPTFNIRFVAQVTVKNTNFGQYEFDASNVTFLYQGVTVGQADIPNAKARFLSTKKLDVTVDVSSNAISNTAGLGGELGSNVLTLNAEAKLSGKVKLMMVMKKKKSAQMNCILKFDVSAKTLQNLSCD